jgi:tetratricopeptide (TPR) repeat protein
MLGYLLKEVSRNSDAESAFRAAIGTFESLAGDFPDVTAYRLNLGTACVNLASVLPDTRAQDKEASLRRARDHFQKVVDESPAAFAPRHHLAVALKGLGDVCRDTGRAGESELAYRQARELLKALVASQPDEPQIRSSYADAIYKLGLISRDRGDLQAACDLLREALREREHSLKPDPREPQYREFFRRNYADLAETLVRIGDHAAAAQTAATLLHEFPERPLDRAVASTLLSRCAELATHDATLSREKRDITVRDYASRARKVLAEALERVGNDPGQQCDISWILSIHPDLQLRDPVRAQSLAAKAVAAEPADGLMLGALGAARYRAGDWKGAAKALDRSAQLRPEGRAYWFFLAMTRWRLGDKDEARRWLERANKWAAKGDPADPDVVRLRSETASLMGLPEPLTPRRPDGRPTNG